MPGRRCRRRGRAGRAGKQDQEAFEAMNDKDQKQLGKTLWAIADQLRGAMNADDFRDYMLSFLFLRYLSWNYEEAAKKELGRSEESSVGKEWVSACRSRGSRYN